ncbi:sulfotransferase family protein [Aliiroseovarius sp. 2305UL8-7]|uniref:sulfotransferase family protein n=1 Tax=Aliiroseovarius conchicola TaxID=3121637 RepID=UPI00352767E0
MTRKIVFVVGMHRSGTSLTMQALSAIGAKPGGAMIAGDDHNMKGYWEASDIVAFHDELLSQLGRGWGLPEHVIPVSPDWFATGQALTSRSQVRALLEERLATLSDDDVLAIKDPRMSLFLPLWIDAAKDLGVEPRVIICMRHPVAVANSLQKRDKTGEEISMALWLTYSASSLVNAQDVPVFMSQYNEWLDDNVNAMTRLGGFVGLDVSNVDDPFDDSMVNNVDEGEPSNALVARWWHDLSSVSGGDAVPTKMVERARGIVENAELMSVLATSIRSEVGDTATFAAKRDLEAYRTGFADLLEKHNALGEERDTLAARAQELLEAYQTSAASREDLMRDYLKVPAVIRRLTRLRK